MAWSYDLLDDAERGVLRTASVFAGGFDLPALCAVAESSDDVEALRPLDSLVRKSLVVAHHGAARTRYSLFETIRTFAEELLSATSDREALRDRHAAHFATEAALAMGALERARVARPRSTGCSRVGQPAVRVPWSADRGQLAVATDLAAHAALMGFSVELFETIGWAEALLAEAARADVRRLPRLFAAAGYACFVGRAAAATAHAHRATELEARPGYQSCEPGYATFIEALGQVYCGNLARYVELTRDAAGLPGPGGRTGSRPSSTGCSRLAGSTRRSSSRRRRSRRRATSAPRTGWPTRRGSSGGLVEGRSAARTGDLGRGRDSTSVRTTSGSSKASWLGTPRCCTPRTASSRRP